MFNIVLFIRPLYVSVVHNYFKRHWIYSFLILSDNYRSLLCRAGGQSDAWNVTVNFTLYAPWRHTERVEVLNSALDGGMWSLSFPGRLTPEKGTLYSLKAGWARVQVWTFWRREKSLPP